MLRLSITGRCSCQIYIVAESSARSRENRTIPYPARIHGSRAVVAPCGKLARGRRQAEHGYAARLASVQVCCMQHVARAAATRSADCCIAPAQVRYFCLFYYCLWSFYRATLPGVRDPFESSSRPHVGFGAMTTGPYADSGHRDVLRIKERQILLRALTMSVCLQVFLWIHTG